MFTEELSTLPVLRWSNSWKWFCAIATMATKRDPVDLKKDLNYMGHIIWSLKCFELLSRDKYPSL